MIVRTDLPGDAAGHGFVFTTGRGNDVQTEAIRALEPWVVGRDVDDTLGDLGELSRRLTGDPQLRWLGPEKGVMHMAAGAVLNALWDLRSKRAGQPLWEHSPSCRPRRSSTCVDFRYLSDALTPQDALAILQDAPSRDARSELRCCGNAAIPAYTTTPGWLGYDDEKLCSPVAARQSPTGSP